MGRLTGEAIRSVREAISSGFLDWSPRILLAMYSCEIQALRKKQRALFWATLPPPFFSPFTRAWLTHIYTGKYKTYILHPSSLPFNFIHIYIYKLTVDITSYSRSTRTCLPRNHTSTRPYPVGDNERRYLVLHYPFTASCRRIIRVFRRYPKENLRSGISPAHLRWIRSVGSRSFLGASDRRRAGRSGGIGRSRKCGEAIHGCCQESEGLGGNREKVGKGCGEAEDIEEIG